MKTLLFHRDLAGFTGGHLKVWDYFRHTRASGRFRPRIYFTPDSRWDEANPWNLAPDERVPAFRPEAVGALFLAGMDWQALPPSLRHDPPCPVVNLIQGLRHADPECPLYGFLSHPALRICVSPQVAAAIEATGIVNGPVVTIPNGLDRTGFPAPLPWSRRPIDLLIVAVKRPELGQALANTFETGPWRIVCIDAWLPRPVFLERLAQAKVALLLPLAEEGFYLPALEAMALGSLVVCPDCVGNRSFCLDGRTCLQPRPYQADALIATAKTALTLTADQRQKLLDNAARQVESHDIDQERRAFLDLLDSLA